MAIDCTAAYSIEAAGGKVPAGERFPLGSADFSAFLLPQAQVSEACNHRFGRPRRLLRLDRALPQGL
jgi:hypothetical protein